MEFYLKMTRIRVFPRKLFRIPSQFCDLGPIYKEGGCPSEPGYPARGAFTCNSSSRDSEWAAWVISWAAAKHNKHNCRPRKLFSILFQLPAGARACSLPETLLLHWYLKIDCLSVRQITLKSGNCEIFTSRRHVYAVYLTSVSRDRTQLEPFTWQKATPPSRVP